MSEIKTKICHIKHHLNRFFKNEDGATAIEYALIAGGLSIVIITAVFTIGQTLNDDLYTPVSDSLSAM